MIDFLKQYCRIIAYSLMGLVFAFASFFLLINMYHQAEISKVYTISSSYRTSVIDDYLTSVQNIKDNLASINPSDYEGTLTSSQAQTAYQKLNTCVTALSNDTISSTFDKQQVNIVDVYYLRESYENEAVKNCLGSLSWFADASEKEIKNTFLLQNEKVLGLYINELAGKTNSLKSRLLNNSSFHFTTYISAITYDEVSGSFTEVVDAYSDVATLTEELSNFLKQEMEGAK